MADYNAYVHKLKTDAGCADFDRLYNGINQKLKRQNARKWGALSGIVALLVLSFALYAGSVFLQAGSDDLMLSYVLGGDEISDGPVVGYVFED